jgi:hypothetical protein
MKHEIVEVEDIIEEIPAKNEEGHFSFVEHEENDDDSSSQEEFDEDDEDEDDGYIHVDDTSFDVERIIDVIGGVFVNSEGETITDTLTNINDNLTKTNKILYKISQSISELHKYLEK